MSSLDEQINIFLNERFPKLPDGPDVEGICLLHLDTRAGGCISYFKSNKTLDSWRLATLGLCYGELIKICTSLKGEEKDYFEMLKSVTELILKQIEINEEKR